VHPFEKKKKSAPIVFQNAKLSLSSHVFQLEQGVPKSFAARRFFLYLCYVFLSILLFVVTI